MSLFKYHYISMFKDLIKGNVSVGNIKHALKVGDLCERLSKGKIIKFSEFKYLRAESIRTAVEFHNSYTTGKRIELEKLIDAVENFVNRLKEMATNGDIAKLTTAISGISKGNPLPALNALGHFVDDIRRNRS